MQSCRKVLNCGKIQRLKPNVLSSKNLAQNPQFTIKPTHYSTSRISMVTFLFNQYNSLHKSRFRSFSANVNVEPDPIDPNTFEKVCEETLYSLCDYFEELVESSSHLESADVEYSSGVLTISFGSPFGTYVINKQSPNRQIWLSSPTSGPKRYDYDLRRNHWYYKHDGVSLHKLLQDEIPRIVKQEVDFARCLHSQV